VGHIRAFQAACVTPPGGQTSPSAISLEVLLYLLPHGLIHDGVW